MKRITERIPKPGTYKGAPVSGLIKNLSLKFKASSTEEKAQKTRKKAAPKGNTTNKPLTKYLNNALNILFIFIQLFVKIYAFHPLRNIS